MHSFVLKRTGVPPSIRRRCTSLTSFIANLQYPYYVPVPQPFCPQDNLQDRWWPPGWTPRCCRQASSYRDTTTCGRWDKPGAGPAKISPIPWQTMVYKCLGGPKHPPKNANLISFGCLDYCSCGKLSIILNHLDRLGPSIPSSTFPRILSQVIPKINQ